MSVEKTKPDWFQNLSTRRVATLEIIRQYGPLFFFAMILGIPTTAFLLGGCTRKVDSGQDITIKEKDSHDLRFRNLLLNEKLLIDTDALDAFMQLAYMRGCRFDDIGQIMVEVLYPILPLRLGGSESDANSPYNFDKSHVSIDGYHRINFNDQELFIAGDNYLYYIKPAIVEQQSRNVSNWFALGMLGVAVANSQISQESVDAIFRSYLTMTDPDKTNKPRPNILSLESYYK